ncbi:hypothetical protein CLOM_g12321 [Closterium sp. NIES-68]|nr:hypothetical protein CLOM_g12321 [Closterium sp. NIES-68]GJP59517.1 hypothetical protein CLOP_g12422 [Closterium sp. NIES-67]
MLKPELPPDSPPAASAPGTSTGATGATGVEVLPLTLAIASLVVVVTLVVFITLALRHPALLYALTQFGCPHYNANHSSQEPARNVTVSVLVPTPSGLHPARLATFPVKPYRLPPAAGKFHVDPDIEGVTGENTLGDATAAERSLALATDASEPVETPGARDIHELLDYGGLKASKECTVCLCDFNEGELVRSLPPCAHRFHVSCIDHWLAARTTCPVCRIDLETQTPDATIQSVTVKEVEGSEAV